MLAANAQGLFKISETEMSVWNGKYGLKKALPLNGQKTTPTTRVFNKTSTVALHKF